MTRTRDERVLCDVMLGKLARYLRMCGYDAAYALDEGVEADEDIIDIARAQGRTIVTRDRQLAARTDGVRIDAREIEGQLRELQDAGVALTLSEHPARCGRCNAPVDPVDTDASVPAYAPNPAETQCYRCRDCGQVFWKGSHWDDVGERIDGL